MNNVRRARIGALLAVLGAVCSVGAQQNPTELTVRFGAFFPGQIEARDASSQWFAAGLEYRLRTLSMSLTEPAASTAVTVSADYMAAGDFRNVPILVNYLSEQGSTYWSFGAGVGLGQTPETETSGSTTIFTTKSRTTVAYALRVGYIVSKGASPVFVELSYRGSSEQRLAGLLAMVGTRF